MKRLNIKKLKINIEGKKILKFIKFILLIIMMAEYLYKLDSVYITRVVELILAVSLVVPSMIINNKEEK